MEKEKNIQPPHKSRFYVKCEEYRKPDQKEGTWSYTKVEIFDKEQGDVKIGEYLRNYHSKGERTFFPFKRADGKWFALYSEVYHQTYVMSLPDCKKVAECDTRRMESKFDTSGFCPCEFWVPFVSAWEMTWDEKFQKEYNKPATEIKWTDPEEDGVIDEPYDTIDWHHLDFGFVYGCYWGGEYYIQKIDLSKIDEGTISISAPFSPCEVPRKVKHFSQVIEVMVDDDKGAAYGVSVNGEFYRFHSGTNNVMSTEEENALYASWAKQREENK